MGIMPWTELNWASVLKNDAHAGHRLALKRIRPPQFQTVQLRDVEANPAWTGLTIMCQAALNGGTIDSAPAVVDVRYIRQPHVVDANGQGPVLIANQGLRFYVECIRGPDGSCQAAGRRKTLRCAVQSHPPATSYKWLKNGIPTKLALRVTCETSHQ